MAVKKGQENTRKAAGNAKKAEVAAAKQAAADGERAKAETEQWSKGAKNTKKQDTAADKAATAARKKAEKDALLAAEEASQPSQPKGGNAKTAQKKTRGPDLSQLDADARAPTLNASGIDNALDALSLANTTGGAGGGGGGGGGGGDKIDRHPERRFKAAYAAFEARRLEELAGSEEGKGLRRQQKIDMVRREFERSAENPFNQAGVGRYDMTRDEMRELREEERKRVEERLASP